MRSLAGLLIAAIVIVADRFVVDLDGCGIDDRRGIDEKSDTLTTPEERAEAEEGGSAGQRRTRQAELPPRPAGEVAVEGARWTARSPSIFTEGPAFAAGGRPPPASTSSPLDPGHRRRRRLHRPLRRPRRHRRRLARDPPEELERCERNGLQVVEFHGRLRRRRASRRRTRADVGADCVSLISNLREIYVAGSPIEAWNQVEPFFFPVRLDTSGPVEATSDFDFVFSRILGIPNPSRADLREDYQAFDRRARGRGRGEEQPEGRARHRRVLALRPVRESS